jgi:hypothetical protein
MRKVITLFGIVLPFFIFPTPIQASVSPEIANYTTSTLQIITTIAGVAATLFLIKGGYEYITSTGNVERILKAKQTIKSALIGLALVIAASVIVSVFQGALTQSQTEAPDPAIELVPIAESPTLTGVALVMFDSLTGLLKHIDETSTKPVFDSVLTFLTSTPSVLTNSVIRNFWLIILGIADSFFVLVVALLGLHVMSASTFGFEELELKQLLPRIGLAFLGANVSLFLADYSITTCNVLTKTIIDSTGGINHAWFENTIYLQSIHNADSVLILPLMIAVFLIICIVLLLMYISRLIAIAVGAVLSPLIFLLWALPKFADFAEISIKAYLVSVFTIFVHVVVVQLATAFLALPDTNQNPLLAILMVIGLFASLLKIPSLLFGLLVQTSAQGVVKKAATQMVNVISTNLHTSRGETQSSSSSSTNRYQGSAAIDGIKKSHRRSFCS